MNKPLHIYRSSAGSGKTRLLAREYICLALSGNEYFRYILAMTFTNKSTQEMKDRILHYLYDFSVGKSNDLAIEVMERLKTNGINLTASTLRTRSDNVLKTILHRYSDFSICTIDSFFQRVIRSFSRETGLLANYRLELDSKMVMDQIINNLMIQVTENKELKKWLVKFSETQLDDGKKWDVRDELLEFLSIVEKEEFKLLEEKIIHTTSNKEFLNTFSKKLYTQKRAIENHVFETSKNIGKEIHEKGLTAEDFTYKSRGIYSYINKLQKEVFNPNDKIANAIEDASLWAHKNSIHLKDITTWAQQKWQPQIQSIAHFIKENLELYTTIDEVLKKFYQFGVLVDLIHSKKKYLAEQNIMLMSDSSIFLNKLMQEQEASFIYERVGSFYRHFLLDEFQDTSGFQWKNLLPLILNGISQNYSSLIVGDIKQSIYRWRGGDWSILQHQVAEDINPVLIQSHSLDTNYRSDGKIVKFNNLFFKEAAKLLAAELSTDLLTKAYSESVQKPYLNLNDGFVRIEFINKIDENSFKEESLRLLPKLLEDIQEKGVSVQDIAFLVRTNQEGVWIANYLLSYQLSAQRKEHINYNVISNESLRLDQSEAIVILINALRVLANQADQIARANLAYAYQKKYFAHTISNWDKVFTESQSDTFGGYIPCGFMAQKETLLTVSLVEMVEILISLFKLNEQVAEFAYLQCFQDVVLDFSKGEKNDLLSFLKWWSLRKDRQAIQMPDSVEAAQIITVYKAKGLQFKYVIIPFLNWSLNQRNHDSILWCQSNHEVFKDVGYIPINYNNKLEDTFFKNEYQQEKLNIYLDTLNLLYVAFTRAEKGLIIYAEKEKDKLTNINTLVHKVINSAEVINEFDLLEADVFQLGKINHQTDPDAIIHTNTVSLSAYPIKSWRERFKLKFQGKRSIEPDARYNKANYGIFLHSLLSQIIKREDVKRVLSQAQSAGLITDSTLPEISQKIDWIINHEKLIPFFTSQAITKTEATMLLTDGTERRVDRVAILGKKAWVLDYKTGHNNLRDIDQIREYLNVLKAMGNEEVVGYLVYWQDENCVEVNI